MGVLWFSASAGAGTVSMVPGNHKLLRTFDLFGRADRLASINSSCGLGLLLPARARIHPGFASESVARDRSGTFCFY
jgi:hypothetical protein